MRWVEYGDKSIMKNGRKIEEQDGWPLDLDGIKKRLKVFRKDKGCQDTRWVGNLGAVIAQLSTLILVLGSRGCGPKPNMLL